MAAGPSLPTSFHVVGPDPEAYERIKFLPNGPDGCQLSPAEPAQPAQEEPGLKIVHADVA